MISVYFLGDRITKYANINRANINPSYLEFYTNKFLENFGIRQTNKEITPENILTSIKRLLSPISATFIQKIIIFC